MQITLTSDTAQRIRDALGEDVVLSPEAIPGVLARLAVEAPAVYSGVLAEISGSQIRLDSEQELERRRRHGLLRRAFLWWAEYETAVGDRLPAKRHIAAAVPLGIAGLTLVLFVFSTTLSHRSTPALHDVVLTLSPDRARAPHERQITAVTPARHHTLPGFRQLARAMPPSRSSEALMPPFPSLPSLPALPGPGASVRGNPVVVSLQAGPLSNDLPPLSVPVVYDRSANAQISHGESEDHIAATQSEIAGSPGDSAAATDAALSTHAWSTGARIQARLATGLVVVAGDGPVPVVVETADPEGTWLGQAVLGPGDLVHVTLTLAHRGQVRSVRGVALDPDRLTPGLLGQVSMRHPHAAAVVAASALRAAGEYVQALARQSDISFMNGWALPTTGQPASAWAYLATRLAQEFDSRGIAGTWVTTAEIPVGSRLVILVTEAS